MDFGIKLKELRVEKKLTQLQMAEILDTSKSNISKYEAGSVEPNLETLVKISKYFNVPIDYLLGNEIAGVDYAAYKMDTSEFGCEFKCKLRDILQEKGISAKQFSEMTGFHEEEVDLYLYGNKIPTLEDLIKISGVLEVSADYLLNLPQRRCLSEDEQRMLVSFNLCDDECKKYLIAKAGVLCVEGISAVAAGEYGKYVDEEKKSYPSSGTGGKGA